VDSKILRDRKRYSPDSEPRTDDVSYDHTLISSDPYFDGSRILLNGQSAYISPNSFHCLWKRWTNAPLEYIATHVPEERNAANFFRLLVNNRARIILNLTEPFERSNKVSCLQSAVTPQLNDLSFSSLASQGTKYWPSSSNQTLSFPEDGIKVDLIKETHIFPSKSYDDVE